MKELINTILKKRIMITAIVFIAAAIGCSDSAKKENSDSANNLSHTIAATEEIDSIELNNGSKWKIAEGMINYIRNMESDVKLFSETNNKNLNDLLNLGSGLQKNINLLTSNCTMTGKAHDELHKWLLPYIDLVDKLNKSKDSIEAKATFIEIENAFIVFNKYFE